MSKSSSSNLDTIQEVDDSIHSDEDSSPSYSQLLFSTMCHSENPNNPYEPEDEQTRVGSKKPEPEQETICNTKCKNI